MTTLRSPCVSGATSPRVQAGRTVTVDSTDPDVDYRMRAQQGPAGRSVVLALPLDDVQESMRQLVFVVLAASLAVLAVLGAGDLVGDPSRCATRAADDGDRRSDRGG